MHTPSSRMETVDGDDSAAQIIKDLAASLAISRSEPKKSPIKDGAPFVILRNADGSDRVEFLTQREEPPHRKFGTVTLMDTTSFIEFCKTHQNPALRIYATIDPAKFTAIIDDHTAGNAGYRDFRAEFTVAFSREYDIWNKHNGKNQAFSSTTDFAHFLEENAPDLLRPDPAKMLEIALNFRVNQTVGFAAASRLQDGSLDFTFKNVVEGNAGPAATGKSGRLQIPESFTINIPIFAGLNQKLHKIDARFRYRLDGQSGGLSIWYELIRPHKVVESAFEEIWKVIGNETKTKILHGKP